MRPSLTRSEDLGSRGVSVGRDLRALAGLPGEPPELHDGGLLELGVDHRSPGGDPRTAVADVAEPVGLAEVPADAERERLEDGGAVGRDR